MNNNMIPFDESKWKEGWKPVTRDGREPEDLRSKYGYIVGKIDGINRTWHTDGNYAVRTQSQLDLLLLPSDDEIVARIYSNGESGVFVSDINIPDGKYRLTKIG